MDTIREFRVEANAYSAEFGRNSGGQINVLTQVRAPTSFSGSAFEFHRNDAIDARNFFDAGEKPDFHRNQFGGTVGGPISDEPRVLLRRLRGADRAARPHDLDRRSRRQRPARHPAERQRRRQSGGRAVPQRVPARQRPLARPGARGPQLPVQPDGSTSTSCRDASTSTSTPNQQLFARYTLDDTNQFLPTDYPQFPREFLSRNQFFTGEYRHVLSRSTLATARLGFSRTRIGQNVEANTSQPLARVRAGPRLDGRHRHRRPAALRAAELGQPAARAERVQLPERLCHTRGRHVLKAGGLVEHYQDNMVNPTFSLGIYAFPNLSAFLRNTPNNFVGLTPEAQFDRYWRFTLFGFYVQDDFQITPRLTLNGGLRYEFTTLPADKYGRDSALPDLTAPTETVGPLYENPTYTNLSPRGGFAWDLFGDGRTSLRGGYGLYFNTNNHQNLIVTVTNPPFTPRPVIVNPTFPNPPFDRAGAISIRPIQYDLENPRVHVYNVNVQRELLWRTAVTVGYAGSRGRHLLRSNDVNTALSDYRARRHAVHPRRHAAAEPRFSTIELKSSDGDSWYNALILDVRRRWSNGLSAQSSYTFSKSEDTTQASTFFSDATNGTTSAMPEYIPDYNKGLSDFDVRHNWVLNFSWDLPFANGLSGVSGAILDGWNVSGIWTVRSGQPLTVFVTSNRSRSQWNPSRGPGIGQDRPELRARLRSRQRRARPTRAVVQPRGIRAAARRHVRQHRPRRLHRPEPAHARPVADEAGPLGALGRNGRIEFRIEAFNILNRANFGVPELRAFAGQADNEATLATFGRITNTVTSSRQIQLGIRAVF